MKNYETVRVHPIFKRAMSYAEHFAGNLKNLGDSLGRDCFVEALDISATSRKGFSKRYKNDGMKNEDWFTFGAEVLAPVSGKVTSVYVNPITNTPGSYEQSKPSSITICREDGKNILLAHIQDPLLKEGEKVKEGQVIAYGGNNGPSRLPHVHIGAWKGEDCFQIEFDLYKMGELVKEVGEVFYVTGFTEQEYKEFMMKASNKDNVKEKS
ncbi:peptidoglycan DD-metalloendopeptidase family protein [Proteinivorax tanatarense]|uniref:Peptidoglycan DD-metalloendopeptidase family protein n=1 Tax=Proteinivorax tanatarense TaxID=1260629 RepID=A0AAU7VMP1_9FIRM